MLAAASAQNPDWFGLTYSPATSSAPGHASLVHLNNADGSISDTLVTVDVGNLTIASDAFRCMPYGIYCVFTATDEVEQVTFLYNVSSVDGTVESRTALNGTAYNLHMQGNPPPYFRSGAAYTIVQKWATPTSPPSAVVVAVQQGVVTPLVDISAHLGATGRVKPGRSTQCSDDDMIWVQVDSESPGTPSLLLGLNTANNSVVSLQTLLFPGYEALWALCNTATDNDIGGVLMSAQGTLQYGSVSPNGSYVLEDEVKLPEQSPPLVLTPLLSMPPFNDYFATLYPEGSGPGDAVSGYLALGDNGPCCGTMTLVKIGYYLHGAARTQ